MPAISAFLLVLAPLGALAQDGEPAPIIRSETRAVQVDAVVKNHTGGPILGLTKDDFAILDDGRPRPVQFFSMDRDASNIGDTYARPTGRLTAIILDGLNTEFQDQSYARDQAMKAVRRMPEDETIAVLALTPGL